MDHSISDIVSNQSTSISDSQKKATVPKGTISKELRVVDMKSTGIALSYDVTEIRMKAGETLFIRYHNASEMNHNIVIVKSEEDINPVGIAALSAQADDFVPQKLNPTAYFSQEQDRILPLPRWHTLGIPLCLNSLHLVPEPIPTSAPTPVTSP